VTWIPVPGRRWLAILAVASLLFLWSTTAALLADAALLAAGLVDWIRTRPPSANREAPRRLSLRALADVRIELRNLARRPIDVVVTDDLSAGLERIGGWWDARRGSRRPMLGLPGVGAAVSGDAPPRQRRDRCPRHR
jgi:hypothetical protein